MIMLVTLEQASAHLRRDTNDDDADLTLKIQAASAAVINYLKDAVDFIDSSGTLIDAAVPYPVKAATLLIIGQLYNDREGQDYTDGNNQPRLGDMSLPKAAHWLLDGIRTPTMG